MAQAQAAQGRDETHMHRDEGGDGLVSWVVRQGRAIKMTTRTGSCSSGGQHVDNAGGVASRRGYRAVLQSGLTSRRRKTEEEVLKEPDGFEGGNVKRLSHHRWGISYCEDISLHRRG